MIVPVGMTLIPPLEEVKNTGAWTVTCVATENEAPENVVTPESVDPETWKAPVNPLLALLVVMTTCPVPVFLPVSVASMRNVLALFIARGTNTEKYPSTGVVLTRSVEPEYTSIKFDHGARPLIW